MLEYTVKLQRLIETGIAINQ